MHLWFHLDHNSALICRRWHYVNASVDIDVLFALLFAVLLLANFLQHPLFSTLTFSFKFCYFHCSGLRYDFLLLLL